jgi:hypothetical protein
VLALTKVNVNNAQFGDGLPVTLRFADQVGETSRPDLQCRMPHCRLDSIFESMRAADKEADRLEPCETAAPWGAWKISRPKADIRAVSSRSARAGVQYSVERCKRPDMRLSS